MKSRSGLTFAARLLCSAAFTALTSAAQAQSPDDEAKARLRDAIALCDTGASSPLDPDAKAPPVQFYNFHNATFSNGAEIAAIIAACDAAVRAEPDTKRFRLQMARTIYAQGKFKDVALPIIEKFADEGYAEAKFLLAISRRTSIYEPDLTLDQLRARTRPLVEAAEAGHALAMMELMSAYRDGPSFAVDPKEAARWADRLGKAQAQGPVAGPDPELDQLRARAGQFYAGIVLRNAGFPADDYARAWKLLDTRAASGMEGEAEVRFLKAFALRRGHGVDKNPAAARALFETDQAQNPQSALELADMLLKGEGGPADPKRAIALLKADRMMRGYLSKGLLAEIELSGQYQGRDPRAAIRHLDETSGLEAALRLADLLPVMQLKARKDEISRTLHLAMLNGNKDAARALAKLKLSEHSDFKDVDRGRKILESLAREGDNDALVELAATQYANLASTSYQPSRRATGPQLSDDDIRGLVEKNAGRKDANALLLLAQLTRKGVIFPQDDQAATRALIASAEAGNVEAMYLAGKAYDDGLGIAKDKRARLKFWREAARRGHVDSREALASAFTFDSFDKLSNLREGITEPLILWANGEGWRFGRALQGIGMGGASSAMLGSMFMGGRAGDATPKSMAGAVLDAVRLAPALQSDERLVALGRALPQPIKIEIERTLVAEGLATGAPEGYFGPEMRAATLAWAERKGHLEVAALSAPVKASAAAPAIAAPSAGEAIAPDAVSRALDKTFKAATDARTDRDKTSAIKMLNTMASYGEATARWAIMRNYHQSRLIRGVVSPQDMTRYAIDLIVSRPAFAEKVDFEFIFNVTQIYQDGKMRVFATGFLDTLRDDPRLHDPLVFGGVTKQLLFAPGACDWVGRVAFEQKISGVGKDGCEDASRDALIAWAKSAGPSGAEARARKAAAPEVAKLAQ